MEIIIGNYKSQDFDSLLAICENVKSEYDGMLHAGIIHYEQQKMGDECGFTLKAAISQVLNKCPSVWPIDLPERIEKGEEPKITNTMANEFDEINEGLIIPIGGYEISRIIYWAKQFLAENGVIN